MSFNGTSTVARSIASRASSVMASARDSAATSASGSTLPGFLRGRSARRAGHHLGDGIKDAPALHAADAGISVESAVDIARGSADVVLLSRNLDVLREGIEDGRQTFANTLKYISITTSANFGNMVSMALVTPLLPFLPLAPKQILRNNFMSDIPSIAISTDNIDREGVVRRQRWSITHIQRSFSSCGHPGRPCSAGRAGCFSGRRCLSRSLRSLCCSSRRSRPFLVSCPCRRLSWPRLPQACCSMCWRPKGSNPGSFGRTPLHRTNDARDRSAVDSGQGGCRLGR